MDRLERGTRWAGALAGDVRFAARHFARRPLTAATIVLVLALGIGVNSALFSVVQAFTTRPAPAVPRDDAHVRLLGAEQAAPGARWEPRGFSLAELGALAARTTTFAAVAGWTAEDLVVDRGDGAGPRAVRAQFVTPDFFAALGVAPALGSDLRGAARAGAADVVVSHALWTELFGGERAALGAVLRVNDVPLRVVGVAPPRFQGAVPGQGSPGLWIATSARSEVVRSARWETDPDSALFQAFARLAPGVTAEQASAIARTVAARAAAERARRVTLGATVVPLRGAAASTPDDPAIVFTAVGTIALLVLLVACTNVSSLLVASAVGRRHEIATRLSLGASRARVVRQLLTESTLLATAGGAAGLLLYWWITRLLAAQVADVDIAPDLATVSFTVLFALVTGIAFGLSPALHATRGGVAVALRDSGAGATRRSRLQHAFVVAQIVCTQPLLVVLAVLLSATVGERGAEMAPGVDARVVSARFAVPRDAGGRAQKLARVRALAARLAEHPEVTAVVPEAGAFEIRNVTVPASEGVRPTDAPPPTRVWVEGAAPGYFALLDVPILRGRGPAPADTAGRETAIVIGSDLARALFGAADPIGRRLASADWRGGAPDARPMLVVGVFDATRATTRGAGPRVYTADGARWRHDALLVRTRGPARTLVPGVRALVRAEAPELPVVSLGTLEDLGRAGRREAMRVAGGAAAVAALALTLASIGLYALVALTVVQRTREIGIRLALGGSPAGVAGTFFASGLRLTVVALLLGLPVSMLALRVALSRVVAPGVSVPAVGAAIALVVLAIAAAATWLPARRASALDPLRALRAD